MIVSMIVRECVQVCVSVYTHRAGKSIQPRSPLSSQVLLVLMTPDPCSCSLWYR